jgi:hypothetical protein
VIVVQIALPIVLIKMEHLAPGLATIVGDASGLERYVGSGSELPPSPCSFC